MASKKRIKYPGACYHVYSRGVDHRAIFQDELDCRRFLHIISQVHSRHSFNIYAYCLMGNHYHLCIETPEENIGDIMRDINSKYVLYFNKKYKRTGRLFESPFCDCKILLNDSRDFVCHYPPDIGKVTLNIDRHYSLNIG